MVTKRSSSRRRNNSETGVSKAKRGNRPQAATKRPARQTSPIDLLANLHAYRRSIAARFNYDAKKIGAYFDAVTIPPSLRVVEFPETRPRSARKSA